MVSEAMVTEHQDSSRSGERQFEAVANTESTLEQPFNVDGQDSCLASRYMAPGECGNKGAVWNEERQQRRMSVVERVARLEEDQERLCMTRKNLGDNRGSAPMHMSYGGFLPRLQCVEMDDAFEYVFAPRDCQPVVVPVRPACSGGGNGKTDVASAGLRLGQEDSFEYVFDKREQRLLEGSASEGCDRRSSDCSAGTRGKRDDIMERDAIAVRQALVKEETFEGRALRFKMEDWNLVAKTWGIEATGSQGEYLAEINLGAFHSPSDSDSSSLLSTLDSSSFSCRSETSSSAKGNTSPTSVMSAHPPRLPSSSPSLTPPNICLPPSVVLQQSVGLEGPSTDCSTSESQQKEALVSGKLERKFSEGSFLEYNFLEGRLVESSGSVDDGSLSGDSGGGTDQEKLENFQNNSSLIRTGMQGRNRPAIESFSLDSNSLEYLASGLGSSPKTAFLTATTRSPESEALSASSRESDWVPTGCLVSLASQLPPESGESCEGKRLRDKVADTSNISRFGDHGDECSSLDYVGHLAYSRGDRLSHGHRDDWDISFQDVNSTPVKSPALVRNKSVGSRDYPLWSGGSASTSSSRSGGATRVIPLERDYLSLSQKTRSPGFVLSQRPSPNQGAPIHQRSQRSQSIQGPLGSQPDTVVNSPVKVTAATIEWLWSENGTPVPSGCSRGYGGDRETNNLSSTAVCRSPAVRNLNSAFGDPRDKVETKMLSKTSSSPSQSWKHPLKESRAAILASWAAVYGAEPSEPSPSIRKTIAGSPAITHGIQSPKPPATVKKPLTMAAHRALYHNPGAPLSKSRSSSKSGSKTLATEALSCKPFIPGSKAPKVTRQTGKPPLFAPKAGHSLSRSLASHPIHTVQPPMCRGRVQCMFKDGLPSYTLLMDETEEIFVAKIVRGTDMATCTSQEEVHHVYTIHSWKGKGKGKGGWRSWGKKEKTASDFVGKLRVCSRIGTNRSCGNKVENYVESEFTLVDSSTSEPPTMSKASPDRRISLSSWDSTPGRSPWLPYAGGSSPNSEYYSMASPSSASFTLGSPCTPRNIPIPSCHAAHSLLPRMGSASPYRGKEVVKSGPQLLQLEQQLSYRKSMPVLGAEYGTCSFQDFWSDAVESMYGEEPEVCVPQPKPELAAVVVRVPLRRGPDQNFTMSELFSDNWGWGINFLRRGDDQSGIEDRSGEYPCSTGLSYSKISIDCGFEQEENEAASERGSPKNGKFESNYSQPASLCGTCGHLETGMEFMEDMDRVDNSQVNVTVILPAGDHGCTSTGLGGPQPLLDRWRSGGMCDCGSWDLGCGLTVLGNQRAETGKSQQVNVLNLFVQGKKQETVALSLQPLKESLFSLAFQDSVSPLKAFAATVAILHSRDPLLPALKKEVEEVTRRTPRIPVRVVPSVNLTPLHNRSMEEMRPFVGYSVTPDPPFSPFARS